MSVWAPYLYLVVLVGAFLAGKALMRETPRVRSRPYATVIVLLTLSLCLLLQLTFPSLLTLLERSTDRILDGQVWRLLTPLFFQDGGFAGGVFNLTSLFLVGSVAEALWAWPNWLVLFFGSGVLSEVVGLAWQPVGAGNSVGNFGLAASVAVFCLLNPASLRVRILAAMTLLPAVFLLSARDIHGAAFALGMILACALLGWPRLFKAIS